MLWDDVGVAVWLDSIMERVGDSTAITGTNPSSEHAFVEGCIDRTNSPFSQRIPIFSGDGPELPEVDLAKTHQTKVTATTLLAPYVVAANGFATQQMVLATEQKTFCQARLLKILASQHSKTYSRQNPLFTHVPNHISRAPTG